MNQTNTYLKLALAASICGLASGFAQAQSPAPYADQRLTIGNPSEDYFSSTPRAQDIPGLGIRFQRHGDHQMWNTILIVSAVLAFIGIVDDDAGLAILGGAGVVVSLVETNQMGFRMNLADRGVDLANVGPMSFGFQPAAPAFGGTRTAFDQPGLYLKASFKF